MWRIQISVLLAMLVCLDHIQGDDPSTGICETANLVPVHPPFDRVNAPLTMKVVYSTEYKYVKDETYLLTPVGGTNFTVVNVKTGENTLPQTYEYGVQIINDIWYEFPKIATDPPSQYIKYMLGITPSLAAYFYRCSESGVSGVYQRFIVVPAAPAPTPPEEEIQTLVDMDRDIFGNDKGILGRLCY